MWEKIEVEMRYKPERALTQFSRRRSSIALRFVEMRYKPERALTRHIYLSDIFKIFNVEMRYKPESKVLVFVTRKMIKEWCERQVPRKVLGDSHLKNLDNWLKKIGRYANIHL